MAREIQRKVNSLVKHELGNILQISQEALNTDGYKDEYVRNDRHEQAVKNFSETLETAVSNLKNSENLISVLDYLSPIEDEFESTEFHEGFRKNYENARDVVNVAKDYVKQINQEDDDCLPIEEVFESYSGEYEILGCEGADLQVDKSFAYVLSTLEENSHRHGGDDLTTNVIVYCLDGDYEPKEEYVVPGWAGFETAEYKDHLAAESEDEEYRLLFWDDGEGLDEEYQENPRRIFRKGEGENSGLGLHLSKEIIESFDGQIDVIQESHSYIPEESGFKLSITLPGNNLWGS